jgi:hypothetical protein
MDHNHHNQKAIDALAEHFIELERLLGKLITDVVDRAAAEEGQPRPRQELAIVNALYGDFDPAMAAWIGKPWLAISGSLCRVMVSCIAEIASLMGREQRLTRNLLEDYDDYRSQLDVDDKPDAFSSWATELMADEAAAAE